MTRIELYDTTLRDGSQGEGVSFSLQDKVLLTARLDSLGFDYVEGGYPASNEKDSLYFKRAGELALSHAKVCAFGMTRRRGKAVEDDEGLKALLGSGAEVITIVGKGSAFQATEILRVSEDENLAMVRESICYLRSHGRRVIFDAEHFFDGWKRDADYTRRVLQAAIAAGAERIVFCDTNGGTLPDEIFEITTKALADLPKGAGGIHCHNDSDVAVANSLAAVDAGVRQVQGTINGFGERCGNADLISVAANLALKKRGYEVLSPDAVQHLTELSRYVYEMVNMNFPLNQPFVGRSAFAHKGGMHVSGIARHTSAYEHIEPERVGNERRVLVSELSGRSNIMALAERHKIDSDPKLMDRILAMVVSKENAGYQYEAADASFDLLVKRCMGTFRPHFKLIYYHVNVEADEGSTWRTEATVKIEVDGEVRHEVADGHGPINALDGALRKALNGRYQCLANMHLVDYKVRVINSEAATAAGVRVMIESRDDHSVWGTVGVSENVIEASWIALVDSFEYRLCKECE